MNSPKQTTLEEMSALEILQEAERLMAQFKTVQMATLNSLGNPEASYTPYIKHSGDYYIFVSRLASHTNNIAQHPTLSLFFVQNEAEAKNLFARKRMTLECRGIAIEREDSHWNEILDLFQRKHGTTVELLRTLPDFILFKLSPMSATFIKGFGQAFKLEGEGLRNVSQVTGK